MTNAQPSSTARTIAAQLGGVLACVALAACDSASNNSTTPTAGSASMPNAAAAASAGAGQPTGGSSAGTAAPDRAGSGGGMSQLPTNQGGAGPMPARAGTGGSAGDAPAPDAGASADPPDSGGSADSSDAGAAADGGAIDDAGIASSGPPPTIADFADPGPYGQAKRLTNQGAGTVSGGTRGTIGEGGDDPSAFTVLFPESATGDERFPLLTWGNGTFCSPTLYDSLFDFIVSYGYVIVATNTSNAGSGSEMLQAVDWALAENDKPDSPLYGLIDPDAIGAFGHSQGGEGAVNTGSDPRIRALAPLSAGPMGSGEGAIQCPTFYTLAANDVVTPDSYRASYDATNTPSVYGVTSGGDHMEYTDRADGLGLPGLTSNDAEMTRSAITAWFEWQLKHKDAIEPLFVGADCGFCDDPNWMSFESKGF